MFYGTDSGVGELIYKNEIRLLMRISLVVLFTGYAFWFLYGRNDALDNETWQSVNAAKKFGNRNRQVESDETVGGDLATVEVHWAPCDANDMV